MGMGVPSSPRLCCCGQGGIPRSAYYRIGESALTRGPSIRAAGTLVPLFVTATRPMIGSEPYRGFDW